MAQAPKTTVPVLSGKARHKAAQAALLSLSDNLPPPPDVFDPAQQYRVRLSRTVRHGAVYLRPSHDVVMSGAFAEQSRDAIIGAQEVG